MLVRKTVSDTLRTGGSAAGELVNVVHHVVMGTIGAVEQAGTGLTMSIKSVAKGIVMGVHDVGADIGVVARRAVDGVIEATVETGGNVGKAGKISTMAVASVKDVLHGVMGGADESARAKAQASAKTHSAPGQGAHDMKKPLAASPAKASSHPRA